MREGKPASTAIYYVPSGYSTAGAALMGINVASEGSLRALARYSGAEKLYALTETLENAQSFDQAVRGFNPAMATEWIPANEVGRLRDVGSIMLPGPGLGSFGWMRRRAGRRGYSLCGITHTTATPLVLDAIAELLTAPVYPWDALICTSRAVHSMVSSLFDDQQAYLEDRFGTRDIPRPALPIIPLGVECDDFVTDPALRRMRREQLDLTEDDVVYLWVGRLSPHTKANPLPLFQAMELAAKRTTRRLHLTMAGWFSHDTVEQAYHRAAETLCPSVDVHFVDGREPVVRREIWQVADVFVSPVDNIQETFGLTPVEAMAAGLPVIISDWNGYRDTVRDGIDGFCIPTVSVPPGVCNDLGIRYGAKMDNYESYIGYASQVVAVDVGLFADAIVRLADDPALRRAMGDAGKKRARSTYDWRQIVPQYRELWTALEQERAGIEGEFPEQPPYPARPDPFHAFSTYPSGFASGGRRVRTISPPPGNLYEFLDSPLVSFARPVLPSLSELTDLLARSRGEGELIENLVAAVPDFRRQLVWRGIVWLAKFNFVKIV